MLRQKIQTYYSLRSLNEFYDILQNPIANESFSREFSRALLPHFVIKKRYSTYNKRESTGFPGVEPSPLTNSCAERTPRIYCHVVPPKRRKDHATRERDEEGGGSK